MDILQKHQERKYIEILSHFSQRKHGDYKIKWLLKNAVKVPHLMLLMAWWTIHGDIIDTHCFVYRVAQISTIKPFLHRI